VTNHREFVGAVRDTFEQRGPPRGALREGRFVTTNMRCGEYVFNYTCKGFGVDSTYRGLAL
jgi:hypothetical protein